MIAGDDVAGDEMIAGDDVAGDEMIAGDDVAGDEMIAGDDVAGDEMIAEVAEPDIVGSYMDEYMTSHVITALSWTQTYDGSEPSVFHFLSVNNENDFIIAENDAMNEYSPSLFSRFDWVTIDGQLWFCQTTYNAETAEGAEATPAADASDVSVSGCGASPWSSLNIQ
jgi:hypothetical protein